MHLRQICLDTETTGIETRDDNRVIEIGCIELVNRQPTGNNFHYYLNPDRESEPGALEVHGITTEFLADKPRFHDVVDEFLEYVQDAEVIIHNAPFDVGFLNHELGKLDRPNKPFTEFCSVVDTLVMARKIHPGQRNSLDALCRRYDINNSNRTLHGALLDAGILADVYLAMTGGQIKLGLDSSSSESNSNKVIEAGFYHRQPTETFVVTQPNSEEQAAHNAWLERLRESENGAIWDKLKAPSTQ